MSFRFDGKVAIVTGGAMGIGAATAQVLCELGATVSILDRDSDTATKTVDLLTQSGYTASFHYCDVAHEADVATAIDAVAQEYGRLDVLVSNAGIQRYGNVVNTPTNVWNETIDVNVKGSFYTSKYAIPAMLRSGGGAIVTVASVQSLAALGNSAAYVTSKHALLGLTRSIALDFARQNIRANCVCLGSIDTPLLRWAATLTSFPERATSVFGQMHALGRIGTPEEASRAIAFLASDWASFITGTSLVVDGGLLVPAGGMGCEDLDLDLAAAR
jgi:NAD(P)-dependent dehydrogenase (short-subunit alcohol dehydrogenase family)